MKAGKGHDDLENSPASGVRREGMCATLAMIHTIVSPIIESLCDELTPEVDRFNIVDEGLLRMGLAARGLTPAIYRRLSDDVVCAEAAGADVIPVTCSSVPPCVDVARKMVAVPVLKIDEPMFDQAISMGTRIGVAATAPTTLNPTVELIRARSQITGKQTKIEPISCEGAYQPLLSGDMARHDQIVIEYLYQMMQISDVIVLAQASMAHIPAMIPESDRHVPILSSPRLGIERIRDVFSQQEAGTPV